MDNPLALAHAWLEAHAAVQDLTKQKDALTTAIDNHAIRRTECEKQLRGVLDNQTPQRLFQVEPGVVVMVSATRGVEVVNLEQPPLPSQQASAMSLKAPVDG